MEDTETGFSLYSRYFVDMTGLRAIIHAQVKSPDDMTPGDVEEIRKNADFVVDHQLAAPNSEDQTLITAILKVGYMDGVNPYVRSS